MVERISFYDQISNNKRNSIFLILIVGIMIVLLGYFISLMLGEGYFFFVMIISIILGVLWPVIAFYNCDKIAVASVGAVKADPRIYKQYYNSVEGLCLASGMPMPKLYIMNSPEINAFATGRDPKHAVICVTTGCLQKLNKQELEGVLAHELAHIANYDIRFMTLTAVLVGIISIMAEIFLRSLWLTDRRENNGKFGAILIIAGLVLAILAPIVTTLVQLAISRKREFVADATAVKIMRTPTGLIGALTKIKGNHDMKVSGSVAPLFISKPKRSSDLFSTHPNIDKRIDLLKRM